jgi:hypothetical protein
MPEGTTEWFEYEGKTMRIQHIAGDLFVDFKVGEYELEGAMQIREADTGNPGMSISAVAIGFGVVKAVIKMVETGEWKKHFPAMEEE